jgi:prepilin-type processing-associated H-X9-DG protein
VLCPNAEWAQSKENIRNSGAVIRRSYGSSTHGTGGGWGQKGEKVLTRYPDEVVGPASKVHFGEGLSWVVNRWHADLSGRNYFELGEFPPDWGWGTRGGVTAYRHHTDFAQQKGNTNQLMFDGHVRTVNREDIMWRWQWEPLWD